MSAGFVLIGQIESWPTKNQMATLLRQAGLTFELGRFSISMTGMEHFVFQGYGGDLGKPTIDADAATLEIMLRDARLVSHALAAADLRHRFEIYDADVRCVAYLCHRWPQSD
jgi:hypothetical protein